MRPILSTGTSRFRERWRAFFTSRVTWVWILTRGVVVLGTVLGGILLVGSSNPLADLVTLWNRWDTEWYISIAQQGYYPEGVHQNNPAFFPLFPMLIRVGIQLGLSPAGAGMLISLIASLIAAFGLARLTREIGGRPELGVLAWLLAPTAVFLFAPYTEATFAAFAIWAWVYARQRQWALASILAAGASLTRVNGVFLAVGLCVMFLLARPVRWREVPWLFLPYLAVAGYFLYLHAITGSWTTWFDVQSAGWDRHFTDPVHSFLNTVEYITGFVSLGMTPSRFVMEIAAAATLGAFVIVLGIKRWWPEMVYAALTLISLVTSTYYYAIPRSLTVVFPIWMLIGLWMTRRKFVRIGYVIVMLPFLLLVTARLVEGRWIS